MTTVTVADQTTPTEAYLAMPVRKTKAGIILVHEAWGLTDHIKTVADRLAAEGYVVLAPELLAEQEIVKHADQLQADLYDPVKRNDAQTRMRELMAPLHDESFVRQTVKRLKACFDYLSSHDDTDGRVAVLGFSFGGTYAFQLAAEEPLLKAAIAYYGHAPLREGRLQWVICPVLAFYGEHDERLVKQLPEVEQAMSEASVSFEAKVYDDAGHAFFNDANPNVYNQAAAEDAWQRSLEFLQRNAANPPLET